MISQQEDEINNLLRQAKEEEAAARLAAQKAAEEAAAKKAAEEKAAARAQYLGRSDRRPQRTFRSRQPRYFKIKIQTRPDEAANHKTQHRQPLTTSGCLRIRPQALRADTISNNHHIKSMPHLASHLLSIAVVLIISALPASANKLPYEFTYNGKQYRGYEGVIDGLLKVSVVRAERPEFDQQEYTVWFENTGDRPTGILEDVYALKTTFKGANPILRGCLGDHENFYRQYSTDLSSEPVKFVSTEGRATHIVFPYFDLVHGKGSRIVKIAKGLKNDGTY